MNPLFGPFIKVFLTVMETNHPLGEEAAQLRDDGGRGRFLARG
jgi:hypothetical protein